MNHKTRFALALSTLGALASTTTTRPAAAATSTPATLYTWSSNQQTATAMFSSSQGYCFLSGVGGAFNTNSASAYVTLSNGTWLLDGAPGSGATYAEARCLPWSNVASPANAVDRDSVNGWQWDTGYSFMVTLSFGAQVSACSVGGIGGNFLYSGSEVSVFPYAGGSSGSWGVSAFEGTQNNWNDRGVYTGGNGNCLNLNNLSMAQSTTSAGTWQNVDLGSTDNGHMACMLSAVGGSIQGSGDSVRVTVQNNGQGDHWILESTGSATGSARCASLATRTFSNERLVVDGKCVDLPDFNTTNGTQLGLWDCKGTNDSNQRWSLGEDGAIHSSVDSTKCIDLPDWNTANGVPMQIYDCNGGTNQSWWYGTDNTLVGFGSKCIDLPYGATNNGNGFQYFDCNGGTNQSFAATP